MPKEETEDLHHPGDAITFAVFEEVELEIDGAETVLESSELATAQVTGPQNTLDDLKALLPLDPKPPSLRLSPRAKVTVPKEHRAGAGIPSRADTFAFIYPTEHQEVIAALAGIKNLAREAWVFTFLVGGFAYYDDEGVLLSVNAIGFADTSASLLLVGPYKCTSAAGKELKRQSRLQNITVSEIKDSGYFAFGWVHPSEQIAGESMCERGESYPHGAFCYIRNISRATVGPEEATMKRKSPTPRRSHSSSRSNSRGGSPSGPRKSMDPAQGSFKTKNPTNGLELVFYKLMTKDEYAKLEAQPPLDGAKGPFLSVGLKQLESASSTAAATLNQAGEMFGVKDATESEGEDEEELQDARKSFASRALGATLACTVGVIFYMNEEELPCEDEPAKMCSWTAIESLYFLITTISTVGYGDYNPSTPLSRFVTAMYILGGVYFIFSFFGEIMMAFIGAVEKRFYLLVGPLVVRLKEVRCLSSKKSTHDGPAPAWEFFLGVLGFNLAFGAIFFIFVSAWIFTQLDHGLTYGDAVWYCWITATTVGYGSELTNDDARTFATLYILLAVSWLASLIGDAQAAVVRRTIEFKKHEMVKRQLDPDFITKLERTPGAGVSKVEFVVGILVSLGAELAGKELEFSDVQPLIDRFEALDQDGSGCLTHDDLDFMAQQVQKQATKTRRLESWKTAR